MKNRCIDLSPKKCNIICYKTYATIETYGQGYIPMNVSISNMSPFRSKQGSIMHQNKNCDDRNYIKMMKKYSDRCWQLHSNHDFISFRNTWTLIILKHFFEVAYHIDHAVNTKTFVCMKEQLSNTRWISFIHMNISIEACEHFNFSFY